MCACTHTCTRTHAHTHEHTHTQTQMLSLPFLPSSYVFLSLSPLPSFFFPAVQEDELAQTVRRFEGQMRDLEQRLEDRSRAGELQGCRTQWSLPGSLACVSMYVRTYVHSVTEYSYVIYVFHGIPLCLICTCVHKL